MDWMDSCRKRVPVTVFPHVRVRAARIIRGGVGWGENTRSPRVSANRHDDDDDENGEEDDRAEAYGRNELPLFRRKRRATRRRSC